MKTNDLPYCFLIFFMLFFQSCDDPLENNRRIIVTGQFFDEDQNPIAEIPIRTEAQEIYLGEGTSDATGSFEYASLETYRNFDIVVNPPETQNSIYSSVIYSSQYNNSMRENIDRYDLGIVTLRRTAKLDFSIIKTTSASDTLRWTISFPQASCSYSFTQKVSNAEIFTCYEEDFLGGSQTPARPDLDTEITSLLGQEAVFTYSINSSAEERLIIPLNSPNNTFDFEY
ncbi:MAG TPA: hypothetical protein ENH91_03230 [Leeuwenhoekiella sp.]|nr:hypothetical protein [Leeuwenhoekiella sp.]